MRRTSELLAAVLAIVAFLAPTANGRAKHGVWVADRGDGTDRNPILYADYSDSDAKSKEDGYADFDWFHVE